MSKLIFMHRNVGLISVESSNGVFVGEILQEIDGQFVFYPSMMWSNGGCVLPWMLRAIADKLDELNQVAKPVCKPCQDGNEANCECEK